MADLEKYLKIFVLRTIGCSQDDVADLLHCGKAAVVDAERWLRYCPPGEARSLLRNDRIGGLAFRELVGVPELTPHQLMKAGAVTGDAILLHYGRDIAYAESSLAAPSYAKPLEKHWERLRWDALSLHAQLSPPPVEALFSEDLCRRVHGAVKSGVPLLNASSWRKVLGVPLELRVLEDAPGSTTLARLPVEDRDLFPHLVAHLAAESDGLAGLEGWKEDLGSLVGICLEVLNSVIADCARAVGLDYLGHGRKSGMTYCFPAYVCEFILGHRNTGALASLNAEKQADGSWRLAPADSPAIALALVEKDHIESCRRALQQQIDDKKGLPVWADIRRRLADLQARADEMRSRLTTVIDRGTFQGTCPLCQGFFTGISS
jgi:hypothetical protein